MSPLHQVDYVLKFYHGFCSSLHVKCILFQEERMQCFQHNSEGNKEHHCTQNQERDNLPEHRGCQPVVRNDNVGGNICALGHQAIKAYSGVAV
jgi:hypothetical protein